MRPVAQSIRDHRTQYQRRDLRFLELGAIDVAPDSRPTDCREWIGAVAQHFGARTVGDPGFELPRCWEFESGRGRRVLGGLEAESA